MLVPSPQAGWLCSRLKAVGRTLKKLKQDVPGHAGNNEVPSLKDVFFHEHVSLHFSLFALFEIEPVCLPSGTTPLVRRE